MIRVLIAEDSATCRELLIQLVESDSELKVIAAVGDGVQAVALATRLRPDVVIMDIHMPQMDGFTATREIMVQAPTPIVIVSGTIDIHQAAVSMRALHMGALTVMQKPAFERTPDFTDMARQFTSTVRAMAAVRVVRRWTHGSSRGFPDSAASPARIGVAPCATATTRVVAIATSTGGPAALHRIFSELPRELPVPILVVQHIAPGFAPALVSWLAGASRLTVQLGQHGQAVQRGTVYVAPDDHHFGLCSDGTLAVTQGPPIGGFRPSATHLFHTVAESYGNTSIAVILTGMGDDGVHGLRAVRARGGRVIAQDQESSVVFGMPAAAMAAGVVDSVCPLEQIATRLQRMIAAASASNP